MLRAPFSARRGRLGGVAKSIGDDVGEPWSATNVPLCTTDGAVILDGVDAARLRGQIRLVDIGVRTVRPITRLDGGRVISELPGRAIAPGPPPGTVAPTGFVVRAACNPSSPRSPLVTIVVTAARTGPDGGYVDGLTVAYRTTDGGRHVLRIPFRFALCGPVASPGPCSSS